MAPPGTRKVLRAIEKAWQELTMAEARARTLGGAERGAGGFFETTEKIPSRASRHLTGAADLPLQQKQELTQALSTPGEYDPYYRALGVPQGSRTSGLGQFTEDVPAPEQLRLRAAFRDARTGKTYQPTAGFHNVDELPSRLQGALHRVEEGFVDQRGTWYDRAGAARAMNEAGQEVKMFPMRSEYLPRETEAAGGARTDYNPNVTVHPGTEDAGVVRGVNTLRSATDVQAAGAYHTVKPSAQPATQTAARVTFQGGQLDPEFTALLYDRVNGAGLNLIDTGGGGFTITGEFGSMPAEKFREAFAKLAPELQGNGAEVELGSYVGHYNEMPAYGEGRVTRKVLEDVSPGTGERLNTPELRAGWRWQNQAETQAASRLGLGPPRADVQKFRSILGRGGTEALRRHVKRYGTAGLPAVTILPSQEEQRQ